ncbi:MAG: Slp family lipoprotein [Nitrospirae bacterium]|nr:Slp family lipoprotein [Nitrospirota bacterium]MDA1303976.1 Slp family lipoprotein [Nitrospirota bacterium]
MKNLCFGVLSVFLVLSSGCAGGPKPIPESLAPQIDKTVSFEQLLENPDAHVGKLVVLGGQVLQATRLPDATRIEVLQLPLIDAERPSSQRTSSQGRFLAYEKTFLDPATLSDQPQVTIVGEVTGIATAKLDETEYRYPTIAIKHIHVWEAQAQNQQSGFGVGLGLGGGGGGFGGGIGIGTGF